MALKYLHALLFCTVFSLVQGDLAGLHFYLYTKANKLTPVEIKSSDPATINNSGFVTGAPVKILCHGYTSSYTAEFPRDLKNIYLNQAANYNVIAVDWAQLASLVGGYNAAFLNTRKVGKEIALLIQALIASGKSTLADFHFIGHSLGGQIGAFISENLSNGQKIPRVTGLDPGRPGFEPGSVPSSGRLDPTDADFVDVIRTSTGIGSNSTVADPPGTGNVDFFPNGGVTQPGCFGGELCSHSRAYKFYEESVTTNVGFKSYKCTSYSDFTANTCPRTNGAVMGEFVPKTISGAYYLQTNSFSPFAKG